MRALTMPADGGIHLDPATAAVGSSLATAILAWLGNRLVGKAAIQTAINTSFREMMDERRDAERELKIELKEARADLDKARGAVLTLEAEIRQKDAIIAGFERTTVAPHGRGDAK